MTRTGLTWPQTTCILMQTGALNMEELIHHVGNLGVWYHCHGSSPMQWCLIIHMGPIQSSLHHAMEMVHLTWPQHHVSSCWLVAMTWQRSDPSGVVWGELCHCHGSSLMQCCCILHLVTIKIMMHHRIGRVGPSWPSLTFFSVQTGGSDHAKADPSGVVAGDLCHCNGSGQV